MSFVATCSASVTLSYQVHVKVCNPIPLIKNYRWDKCLFLWQAKCTLIVLKTSNLGLKVELHINTCTSNLDFKFQTGV